jgi:hypothetical protein
MTGTAAEAASKSIKSNATLMRSFRISKDLDEVIKAEIQRRNTDFSSYVRDTLMDSIFCRPWENDRSSV